MLSRIATLFSFLSLLVLQSPVTAAITVACVGDSITAAGYPGVLSTLLGAGYVVDNFGSGGSCLLKAGNQPIWNTTTYANSLTSNPDVVIIQLGTNDSKPGNWQLCTNFITDYTNMINIYKNLPTHPKVFVSLSTTIFGIGGGGGITEPVVACGIVPLTIQAALITGCPIVDMDAATVYQGTNFPDNIHPNATGNAVLANAIYNSVFFPSAKITNMQVTPPTDTNNFAQLTVFTVKIKPVSGTVTNVLINLSPLGILPIGTSPATNFSGLTIMGRMTNISGSTLWRYSTVIPIGVPVGETYLPITAWLSTGDTVSTKGFDFNVYHKTPQVITTNASVSSTKVTNNSPKLVIFSLTAKGIQGGWVTNVSLDLSQLGGSSSVKMSNISSWTSFRYSYIIPAGLTGSVVPIKMVVWDNSGVPFTNQNLSITVVDVHAIGEVFCYLDGDYYINTGWISRQNYTNLVRTITNQLKKPTRNFTKQNHVLSVGNASQLRIYMKTTPKGIVFLGGGAGPDTVFSNTPNTLIRTWLENGGTVIWNGDVEFYNQSHANNGVTVYGGNSQSPVFNLAAGQQIVQSVGGAITWTPSGINLVPDGAVFNSMRSAITPIILTPYEKYGQVNPTTSDPTLWKANAWNQGNWVHFHGETVGAGQVGQIGLEIADYIDNKFFGGTTTKITSLGIFQKDYSTMKSTSLTNGTNYVKLVGTNQDPHKCETATVIVINSTNTRGGILLTLREMGTNSNIYTNSFVVNTISNSYDNRMVKAVLGQSICAYADVDKNYHSCVSINSSSAQVSLSFPKNRVCTNNGNVTFRWQQALGLSFGISNYWLLLSTNNFTTTQRNYLTANSTVTNFPMPSSLGNGTWVWKVAVFDKLGSMGAISSSWTNKVDTIAPTIPGLISPANASTNTNNSLTLSWSNSIDLGSGISNYRVVLDGATNILSGTAFTTGILTAGTHSWMVSAMDRARNRSAFSPSRTFTLKSNDSTAPTIPGPISPTNGSIFTNRIVTLSWSNSIDLQSGVSNYRVVLDGITNVLKGTSYTTGILALATHTWMVSAMDRALNRSAFSASRTFTIQSSDTTAPTIPGPISPTNGAIFTNRIVILSWSNSIDLQSGVSNYRVILDGITNVLKGTSYTTGILSFATHTWMVSAMDRALNRSAFSISRTFTLKSNDSTPPTIPILLSPINGYSTTNRTLILSWLNSIDLQSGVSNYRVVLDGTTNIVKSNSYSTGILPVGQHAWEVSSMDRALNRSVFSTQRTFMIQSNVPPRGNGLEINTFTISPNPLILSGNGMNNPMVITYNAGIKSKVVFEIYTINATRVVELTDIDGDMRIKWDGLNTQGHQVASGIYMLIMKVDGVTKGKVFKLGVLR